ncbi:MAG: ORF6N domain-containing protein [Lachnospiraceae bacterium]|nr:ORF6N domain-containing protein [Lachnospiraceae bacterium]
MFKRKIYVVRDQKVMLDFELAEIYGYSTKRFNEQVKNNIEKFDEDFRFQLRKEEWENLRSKKSTSSWGGSRYLPYAFTEQGIYMLMTVLRGELATKQSKALIRTFKKMKDYIIDNQNLIGQREYLILSMQMSENLLSTWELRSDLTDVQQRILLLL